MDGFLFALTFVVSLLVIVGVITYAIDREADANDSG